MPQNRKIKMPQVGDIVSSKCGRDRFRVFAVLELDTENTVSPVVIADGKLHKIADKKHKNPRHLRIISHCSENDINTLLCEPDDVQVYEICKKAELTD